MAGNKGSHSRSVSLPLLGWGGKWKEKRQELMGQDKGSLTEQ